jgi:hypothetical protein
MRMLVTPLTWILGVVLLLVGLAGFVTGSPLLVFDVDPLHNIIHVVSGIAGLAMAGTYGKARLFLIVFGLVYGLVAVLGFATGSVLGLIMVNGPDNVLHIAIAAACLLVGFGSPKN